MTILEKLSQWQKMQAQKECVEGYMVVPFGVLKLIALSLPRDEDALLAIKGMGPAKVRKYGKVLLEICGEAAPAVSAQPEMISGAYSVDKTTGEIVSRDEVDAKEVVQTELEKPDFFLVGDFLGQLNQVMGSYFGGVRVRGEVIGFKRNHSGHAYFELKDGEGIMRCAVFARAYEMSGVELSDGVEIIITGKPSHHQQYGFSFVGERVEFAGEGALKRAYDDLKKKMQAEGLMDASRKREVPQYAQRIGLITSPTGAALGDFTTNMGGYGYKTIFHPSRVEGSGAVADLLLALKKMAKQDIDLLVITRGGGSLESLQAFNNENVVRALATFPVPVIAGIGHEQDETLSTLVADLGVSTPTAAARAVRASWDQGVEMLDQYGDRLIESYRSMMQVAQYQVSDSYRSLQASFVSMRESAYQSIYQFENNVDTLEREIYLFRDRVQESERLMLVQFGQAMERTKQQLTYTLSGIQSAYQRTFLRARSMMDHFESLVRLYDMQLQEVRMSIVRCERAIVQNDPRRLLALGYSIVEDRNGKVVRKKGDVKSGDEVTLQVSDGSITSVVKNCK